MKLKYISQIKTRPPTFALVTNYKNVEESYLRFLKNRLQEDFGLHGMDVRLVVKATSESNPFAEKAAKEAAERKRALANKRRGGKDGRRTGEEEEQEEKLKKERRKAKEAIKREKMDAKRKRRVYQTRTVGTSS